MAHNVSNVNTCCEGSSKTGSGLKGLSYISPLFRARCPGGSNDVQNSQSGTDRVCL